MDQPIDQPRRSRQWGRVGGALLVLAVLVGPLHQHRVAGSRRDYLTDRLGLPRGEIRGRVIDFGATWRSRSSDQGVGILVGLGRRGGVHLWFDNHSRWALATAQPEPVDASRAVWIAQDAVVRYLGADPAHVRLLGPATITPSLNWCEVGLALEPPPQPWMPSQVQVAMQPDGRLIQIHAPLVPLPWPPFGTAPLARLSLPPSAQLAVPALPPGGQP